MTILQILQLVSALAGAAKDVSDLATTLRAQGHPDDAPIPVEHQAKIAAALATVKDWGPLGDPDAGE